LTYAWFAFPISFSATLAGIAQNAEQIYCLTPAKMAIQLDVNTKIWHYVTAPSLHD
jgi:hypothetical protein